MMKDEECVSFLQWALPRLRRYWPGFRKVRRQVCKRIDRRICELDLGGVAAYRLYLECHPEEWPELDTRCRASSVLPVTRSDIPLLRIFFWMVMTFAPYRDCWNTAT